MRTETTRICGMKWGICFSVWSSINHKIPTQNLHAQRKTLSMHSYYLPLKNDQGNTSWMISLFRLRYKIDMLYDAYNALCPPQYQTSHNWTVCNDIGMINDIFLMYVCACELKYEVVYTFIFRKKSHASISYPIPIICPGNCATLLKKMNSAVSSLC